MSDATGGRPLWLLHLEDSAEDHALAMAHLRRAGLSVKAERVETEPEYRRALDAHDWDAVLSDFNLPGFDGLQAQRILQATRPEIPFILISGAIGEDAAVEVMRHGASDYLLKNNLARLAMAVEHAVAAGRDRKARLQSDRELARSRQQLSELAQHLQTSIEMERAAIAREIHDDVGGALTALRFDLAWLARHMPEPKVQQRLNDAMESLSQAIGASQRIMHNLRPAILEQGLVPALQWMANGFEKRNGITCRFRTSQESMTLPTGVPLVAYRFTQEALTNVSKHAGADRVSIDLSLARGVLSVEVADNGRGLSEADLGKARSFGLRGLHERASTVGGWVDVSSGPGGTVLMLSVPVAVTGGSGDDAPGYDDDEDHDPTAWGAP